MKKCKAITRPPSALKHGYYSDWFRERELANLQENDALIHTLTDEIKLMKVILYRLSSLASKGTASDKLIATAGAIGKACVQLAHIMRVEKLLEGSGNTEIMKVLASALDDINDELLTHSE